MCAAPGGKTSHLACFMKDSGRIFATDKSNSRLNNLKSNIKLEHIKEWGISSVEAVKIDATKAVERFGYEFFDKVLLDAPCTGLGQRPRLSFQETKIQETAVYQKAFLDVASKVLKVGGKLLYSTCTVSEEG